MYSTTAYIYQQKTQVLTVDTSGAYFTMRYDPVYAKRLTINKGVDNVILFEFINQDQKPVNITGSTLVFRLVSQDGLELLNETPMTVINAQFGRAKVTLSAEALNQVPAQPAGYSISRASGNLTEAVFTDAQAGARAPVDVVDSVYPEFVPSSELTIPTTNLGGQDSLGAAGASAAVYPDWALGSGNPINNYAPYQSTEFYTSHIEPRGPVTTIQMDLVGYTGTIKAQAAQTYQSVWVNVTETTQYLNKTGTIYINVIGWHPLLRLAFNNSVYTTGQNGQVLGYPAQATATINSAGEVNAINVLNGGQGYLAPPLITILGDGSGATATATLNQGRVSGITITNPGSGYRPIPPTMQGAIVVISTGQVINLVYR
jgi:hypothetical protein